MFNFCTGSASALTMLTFPFPEPVANEYSGYIIAYRNAGIYYCLFYNFVPMYMNGDDPNDYQNNNVSAPLRVVPSLDSTKTQLHLSFSPYASGHFTLYEWNSYSNEINYVYYELFTNGTNFGYDFNFFDPLGYIYHKGSGFINAQYQDLKTDLNFDIAWGNDYSVINYISHVQSSLNQINSNTAATVQAVSLVGSKIDTTNSTLNTTNSKLTDIFNRLGQLLNNQSNDSIQDVSSSGITNVENKENALVGSNVSTSELSVDINPLASSVVWNLVDNVVTGNQKVFTMFISILTIAVIGLILNR